MTTIEDELAKAYDDVAEALAELALAIRRGATTPQEPTGAAVTPERAFGPSSTSDVVENLPFDDFEDTPRGRSAAGGCPIHGLPWSVRPAGNSSKTGKPYDAFWKCDGQNADGTYCREKPTAAWVKAHPAR
jgi:hypothetical protein